MEEFPGVAPSPSPRAELQSDEARKLAAWVEEQLGLLGRRVDELEQAGDHSTSCTAGDHSTTCTWKESAIVKQQTASASGTVDCDADAKRPDTHNAQTTTPAARSPLQTLPSKTHGVMQEVVIQGEKIGYSLQESVWDVALLIGHPLVSRAESAFAAFLLFLNIFVQGILLYGSWLLAQDSAVDEDATDGFLMWRLSMAHDVDLLVNEQTLAQRVCSPRGMAYSMLSQSPTQATAVRNLRQYLRPLPLLGAIGPMMCACALMIWFASLSCELCGCGKFLEGVWWLPRGRLRLRHSEEDGQRVQVVSISRRRKVWVSVIIGLRLLVVIVLIYTGSLFLIASERVGDLLLNMAALEIIFNIDELLFRSFMTSTFTRAVQVLDPLPVKQYKMQPYMMRFAFLLFLMILFVPMWLWEDTQARTGGLSALCDGKQNFVFTKYEDGIVQWAETEEIKWDDGDSAVLELHSSDCGDRPDVWDDIPLDGTKGSTARTAVRDVICNRRMNFTLNFRVPTIDGGAFGLIGWYNAPECADSFECFYGGYQAPNLSNGEITPSCLGQSLSSSDVFHRWEMAVEFLRDLAGDRSISSCRDVKDFCRSPASDGFVVRKWCPITCGCHDPSSPNWMAAAGNGCPECRSAAESWFDEARPFDNCTDSTLDELNGDGWKGNWRAMWEHFKNAALPILDPNNRKGMAVFANAMIAGGCAVVRDWQEAFLAFDKIDGVPLVDMCTGEGFWKMKPLSIWCPRACNAC